MSKKERYFRYEYYITLKSLKQAGACKEGIYVFKSVFNKEVEINKQSIHKAAREIHIAYLFWFIEQILDLDCLSALTIKLQFKHVKPLCLWEAYPNIKEEFLTLAFEEYKRSLQ